ncbi:manganese efflux pump MntP family protein [Oceanobacillus bengalensis]|uniref:Putative manganese efflux pump MntP n=1 Tax=Oceanobacillus bengalensis TaxID=1435466 RepID=A0A494YYW6_9BACI|nr:manganese efflux pump MntP family protein [Oceanobacillus bengalensis]RKQ15429.1 manganese efflux pump [Oceanobacillus bengalensis]
MAVALGMDAFSVSLGMGMQRMRLKRIALIGIAIGIFHVIMPFLGILLGKVISDQIGNFAIIASAFLLVAIGAQMIINAFIGDDKKRLQPIGFGLLIIAFTVSLDSFSVGLSLGMSGAKIAIVLFLFGVASTILTWIGLLLGRKVHSFLGVYSEILGGSILCGFGFKIFFG